jgi:D-sedoheptulose 7-phosphate isomerase
MPDENDMKVQRAGEAIDELIATLSLFRAAAGSVDQIACLLIRALRDGKKVLTCGNGGSAADALHMSEELVGRYKSNRRPLPAISLAADPTLLTCIGNDFGFEHVFSRQVDALAGVGDVLVTFSSSGNSPNLPAALKAAKARGAISIALLGKGGGVMAGMADEEIIVASDQTARIQEIHTMVLHCWLEQIDAEFQDAAQCLENLVAG